MTTLFNYATCATLLCAAATAHAEDIYDVRKVAPFHAIEVSGPYTVEIKGLGQQELALSGPRKELDDIETIVKGDTLIVRPRSPGGINIRFNRKERVTIKIRAPGLRSLSNAGSADVSARDVESAQFALNVSGSGDVEMFQLKTEKLNVSMQGSGDVDLGGDVGVLQANVNGSGSFDACSMNLKRASAVLRGSGEVCVPGGSEEFLGELHGSGELTVKQLQADKARLVVTGSGEIDIDGAVGTLVADLNGSGSIDAEELVVQQPNVTVRGSGNVEVRVKAAGNGAAQLMRYDRKGAKASRG
ncbi:head GIN domain-containing protein [Massilia sp. CCM 8734]|uniref:head GIN domain-containing protein n=1 Tax=Massilia sp. CCM 8734 TaxID=2609283 RepID=UPI00141EBF59|nr:head GIN domain-containing protein [Massilia sp. CCM 8734]NHZ99383.1 hypothetical protein [Massilia sp. CCM 8734]